MSQMMIDGMSYMIYNEDFFAQYFIHLEVTFKAIICEKRVKATLHMVHYLSEPYYRIVLYSILFFHEVVSSFYSN